MRFYQHLQQRTAQARDELLAAPAIRECLAGCVSRERYVAFLREAYHHVRHTVPLLAASRERLPASRRALRDALGHYIEEERGHEEWILDDLRACGADADAVRRGAPGFAAEIMLAYVYDYVGRINPAGMLGMVHVLEGTSSALATRAAQSIGTALGLPSSALRYLTSHGALDAAHVRFFAGVVDALPPADQEAVVHVASRVYRLYGDIFRALPA